MGGWVGGWVVYLPALPRLAVLNHGGEDNAPERLKGIAQGRGFGAEGEVAHKELEALLREVGGWVGWVEDEQAVGMSYCGLGLGGWVGGWVDGMGRWGGGKG